MTEPPDELREFTRALFADPDAPPTPEPAEDQRPGNVVPREGNNPEVRRAGSDLAAFTRAMFGGEDQ